jgi:hypothetical protein
MSRTALNRGDYLMAKAAKELEAMGYIVEKAKKVRWAQQDFFGCWDIMAILPADNSIRWVQVSAKPLYDRGVEYKKKLDQFPAIGNKEYWWWSKKDKGWRVYII